MIQTEKTHTHNNKMYNKNRQANQGQLSYLTKTATKEKQTNKKKSKKKNLIL